jgi:hypothetical protein
MALMLTACSRQPSVPVSDQAATGYCFRAGSDQQFDCSAPPLTVKELRDPLAPDSIFSDEELMDLLAEIKRWLAQRRLSLEGKTIPPQLQPQDSARSTTAEIENDTDHNTTQPPSAGLPRPWALILNDFSPRSLQRTNSAQP